MYGPAEIAKRYSDAGAAKTKLPIPKMFVLGVFAGMFIAFGAFGSQVVAVNIEPASLGKLVGALVFPIGLMMVLMAGAELFTGNSLIIVSVLDKKATVKGMLQNWVVVYLGNFVGSLFVAAMLTYGHAYSLFDGALAESVVATAQAKTSLTLQDALLKAILCNILVCIAVWISFSAEDVAGKILGLYLPVTLFVVSGYEHCIANMYFVPAGIMAADEYGIAAGSLNWTSFLTNNLIPVTIGNVIGGVCVVGLGYFFVYLHQPQPAKTRQPESPDWGDLKLIDLNQDVIRSKSAASASPMANSMQFEMQSRSAGPQNDEPHSIEIAVNDATIRVQNGVDPALLRQAINLTRDVG